MLEDIALSKYPIKSEIDEDTKIQKTIWEENEYQFSLIFDPNSKKFLSLESKQLNTEALPAIFEFNLEQRNGRYISEVQLTETQGLDLFKDLTLVIRKEGYLGLYGNGTRWKRIIDESEFLEDD
jgi:hypothetical protein